MTKQTPRKTLTDVQAAKYAKKFLEWCQTPEGKQSLHEAGLRTSKVMVGLTEATRIEWVKLHEPFTI